MAPEAPASDPPAKQAPNSPKPSDNPTKVREPDNTRPPDKPTPNQPQRPMSGEGGDVDEENVKPETEGM